jgi:hypothetical protein
LEFDFVARRYCVLPSELAKLPPDELQFNMLVAEVGLVEENKQREKAKNGKKR